MTEALVRTLCATAVFVLLTAVAEAQPRDTTRLERMFQVEIAAMQCQVELPDEVEDGLDRAVRAEQRRLGLTRKEMAAIYAKVREAVVAEQEAACESVKQFDPSPIEPDED